MKKFDIIKYTQSANGGVTQKEESGVMAPDRDTLIMLYNGCGDRIKILREYEDDESKSKASITSKEEEPEVKDEPISIPQNQQHPNATTQHIQQPPASIPPKFFKIGDICCKLDNGKIYQKQWMRVSQREAEELRIINDVNNKIFPLTGKHIEMLKWVLTEEPQDEASQEVLVPTIVTEENA